MLNVIPDRWNVKVGVTQTEEKHIKNLDNAKQRSACVAHMKEDLLSTQHIPHCVWLSLCELLWIWIPMLECVWVNAHCRILAEVLQFEKCCERLSTAQTFLHLQRHTQRLSLFSQLLLSWKVWCYRTSADDWLVTTHSTQCHVFYTTVLSTWKVCTVFIYIHWNHKTRFGLCLPSMCTHLCFLSCIIWMCVCVLLFILFCCALSRFTTATHKSIVTYFGSFQMP